MTRFIICLLCLLSVFFVSCSKKEPSKEQDGEEVISLLDENDPDPQPPQEKEETPEVTEPPRFPAVDETMTEKSYLTGLPCTPEQNLIRPTAVVLNNHKAALPQCGIADADVIWECNMEGGITRLVAIYSDVSQTGEIGAVRSARSYFIDIASIHGAILVHAGGSPSYYSDVKAAELDYIDGVNMYTIPSDTFWRDSIKKKERGYEHSMETSGEKISAAVQSQRYTTEKLSTPTPFSFYEETTAPDERDAVRVKICHGAYITTEFIYNSENGRYYKESFGESHIEETTGTQLSFENVIILYASHKVVDEDLRLDINLTGEGKGTLFTAGKTLDFIWSRTSELGGITFTCADGTPLMLNPGKTHITLFDKNAYNGVTIE